MNPFNNEEQISIFRKQVLTDSEAQDLYNTLIRNGVYGKHVYHGYTRVKRFFHKVPKLQTCLTECKTVLDVGCANGGALRFLKEQYDIEEFGIDISDEAVKLSPDLNLKQLPISQLYIIPDNSFDIVFSLDVLEHLCTEKAAKTAIKDMVRISRKYIGLSIEFYKKEIIDMVKLHKLLRSKQWWHDELVKYMKLVGEHDKFFLGQSKCL